MEDHNLPPVVQEDFAVMYLVVRESLGMSPGKMAAQVGHAVSMMMLRYMDLVVKEIQDGDLWLEDLKLAESMREWLANSYGKITLRADDKEWFKLKLLTNHVLVIDNGRTEIAPGSETVIGFWPMRKSERNPLLKRLQTVK